MRNNEILIKRVLPPVKRRPKLTATMYSMSISKAKEIEIALSDKRPAVPGVAWSPKYRKYRAYHHQGKKQVFHKLCETFGEACQAKADAVKRFGPALPNVAPFSRELHAPARFRLENALRKLEMQAALVRSVTNFAASKGLKHHGFREKSNRKELSMRRELGHRVGGLITIADQLLMAGELKIADIEEGMTSMAQKLVNPEEAR